MKSGDREKKDPRFMISNKEAIIGVTLVIFNFLWWFGFAYGLGSKPVKEYTYIMGLPAWFFYSCVIGLIVMIALVTFVVKNFFKEVPFDDELEEEGGDAK